MVLRLRFDCASTALRLPFDKLRTGYSGQATQGDSRMSGRQQDVRVSAVEPLMEEEHDPAYKALRLPFDEVHIEPFGCAQDRLLSVTAKCQGEPFDRLRIN